MGGGKGIVGGGIRPPILKIGEGVGGGGSLRWFLVGGGRLETRLFGVYFIMPRRLGPSFRNLILQRLITV